MIDFKYVFFRLLQVYLARKPNPRKKILVPCQLNPPNPKCYVCPDQPEISIKLNVEKTSIRTLEEKILKGALHMVKPDCVVSGNSKVIISSEEGDVDEKVADMMLSEFSIKDGAILDCDDFFQDYNLKLIVFHV